METLDLILRTSAVSFLLLFIVLAVRDGWKRPVIKFSILGAATVTALFIQSAAFPVWFAFPLRLIDACNIAFIWWACLALLDEDFNLRVVHWAGLIAYSAGTIPYRFAFFGLIPKLPIWFDVIVDSVTLALVAHLVWKAAIDYREDLVEKRRGLRIFFILSCALAILVAIFGENILRGMGIGQYSLTLSAAVTLPIAIALNVWVLRLHPEVLEFQPIRATAPTGPDIRPQDAANHARLIDLMDTERVWSETGLTIGALAEKLTLPEHQLRALINKGMGYRNFAQFLNGYRLSYAKSVLADAEHVRLPILTIAMDAGFGSLAPFNRAFKAAEGLTPTEFRAHALANQS